ncbi:MAG TPA: hypothetical protein DDY72_03015, partial [Verrucomicrobia bacterium]|nr:hypothetical protein [Verrucomicrobiota bacterium]
MRTLRHARKPPRTGGHPAFRGFRHRRRRAHPRVSAGLEPGRAPGDHAHALAHFRLDAEPFGPYPHRPRRIAPLARHNPRLQPSVPAGCRGDNRFRAQNALYRQEQSQEQPVLRALSLPADADLVAEAAPRLAAGWNVLIFPEGTRSPGTDRMRPFKRGCAQLALRTGAPVVCLGARYSRRVLGKGQSVWDMGTRCMQATFRADAPQTFRVQPGESLHHAAMRVTEALESRITRLVLDDAREEGIGAPG